jgi:LacI family transcriptional regulator
MLEEANLPYVVIKRHIPGRDINCVISDDVKGALQATEHLISLGHRRIGLITGMPDAIIIWQDRIKGYRKTLEKYNIPFDDKLVCENDNFLEEGGYQCMNKLLELKRHPAAVFIAGDSMAIGAYKAIKRKGLKIPKDIAIVGYDDIELASTMLDPPLATVRTSFFEFGKRSVELLLDIINEEHSVVRKVVIEPVLVIRKSCGSKK